MPDWYLTPSGSAVRMSFDGETKHPDRDMFQRWVLVLGSDGKCIDRMYVGLIGQTRIRGAVTEQLGVDPGATIDRAVRATAVVAYDRIDSLPRDAHGNAWIDLQSEDVLALFLTPSRPSDVFVRRYLARLLYSEYSRSTLNRIVEIGDDVALILGALAVDLRRNAELLAAEGLLIIEGGLSFPLLLKPTGSLIRQVERYGAAKEDVMASEDYAASVGAYSVLDTHSAELLHEYRRYQVALSDVELVSVFRAVAPVVEAIVKELLAAHGAKKQHATLGPAIADLEGRAIGGRVLVTQLSYVLKFTRDLTQHGAPAPTPVLRVACENAFSLTPQLAALFPRNLAV